jgi:glycosyltransferase involved in cell wall biosynthesis
VSNQRVAAIILTKNEERDLPACLESLRGLTSEIHVVDSGSDDRTVALARELGASVTFHRFTNQARQFNWALDALTIGAEWVLRIDADERVTPELASSLVELLPSLKPGVNGVLLPRRIHFLGRPIRWGDSYPVWMLRLFRRGTGKSEEAWMDEHIILDEGTVVKARGDLVHEIPKSLSEWIRKHDWYADRECKDILGASVQAPRPPRATRR